VKPSRAGVALLLVAGMLRGAAAFAEDATVSPYIDQLREEMKDKGQPTADLKRDDSQPDPYIQNLKQKMREKDAKSAQPEESYTERLKQELGPEPKTPSGSYTEQEKARLGPDQTGGAIAAVKEGRSELHAKKIGEIHNAVGMRMGASITRDITAANSLQAFSNIYGSNFAPDLTLFYEYQPWHSEWYGNIGLFGQLGLGYYHGNGTFQFPVHNATTGGTFGNVSDTKFQFFTVPVTLGADYRFNLFRLVRPFVMAGATAVGFYEDRNDGGDSHTADSFGYYASGGVNILLDWISSGASWDLYAEHGIKHYYVTLDYSRLQTVSGSVNVTVSGLYGGLTFEF
jgi:hypothetical protein